MDTSKFLILIPIFIVVIVVVSFLFEASNARNNNGYNPSIYDNQGDGRYGTN